MNNIEIKNTQLINSNIVYAKKKTFEKKCRKHNQISVDLFVFLGKGNPQDISETKQVLLPEH